MLGSLGGEWVLCELVVIVDWVLVVIFVFIDCEFDFGIDGGKLECFVKILCSWLVVV